MTEQKAVEVIATFDECYHCGSKRRMMETLGNELKEKGLLRKDLNVGLVEIGGPILDPNRSSKLVVGGTVPGMYALQDICLGCGRPYIVRIEKKQVRLDMIPPKAPMGFGGKAM